MDITTYFESDDFLNIISRLGIYCNSVSNVKDLMNDLIDAGINY